MLLFAEKFYVVRREADFDRACDEAYPRAATILGMDSDGHCRVEGWERSRCSVEVAFVGYTRTAGMGGHEHVYEFVVRAVKHQEEEQP